MALTSSRKIGKSLKGFFSAMIDNVSIGEEEQQPGNKENAGFAAKLANSVKLLLEMFGSKEMCFLTVTLMVAIFAVGMGTYGIHFSVKFANMDIFLTLIIKSVCSIITVIVCMFISQVKKGLT